MRPVVLGAVLAAAAVAPSAPASAAPPRATVSGTIVVLKPASITVKGKRSLTCRLGTISPRALGFRPGARAKATCVRGVLKRISRLGKPAVTVSPTTRPPSPLPAPVAPAQPTPTGGTSVAKPVSELSSVGNGTIAELDATTLRLTSGIACSLGESAAGIAATYRVGDRVTFHCADPYPEGVPDLKTAGDLVRRGEVVLRLISIAPAA